MKNKKILIIISVLVLISFVFGLTFAAYTYNKTGKTSKLIVGDVYMHYNESNEAILTTAEDTSRFYLDGTFANSIMKSQSYTSDTRNELSKCMDFFKYFTFDNGSTNETFCKGTGTYNGSTLQEIINDGYSNDYLYGAGVIDNNGTLNSNMANQSYTSDTRNELSKCADISYGYFENRNAISPPSNPSKFNHKNNNAKFMNVNPTSVQGPSYTINNFIGLCKGTEKIYDNDLIGFIDNNTIRNDLENLNIITQYSGILSSLETGNLTLNENIKNQTYQEDTRNEVTLCANYFYNKYETGGIAYIETNISNYFKNNNAKFMIGIANNYTLSDYTEYCKGNMTIGDYNFQDALTNNKFKGTDLTYLTSKNIISKSGDTYTINSNIANQEYQEDTRNELSKCMDGCRDGSFDEGSTSETFCKGTGTLNGMSIYDNLATCNQSGGASSSNNNNGNVFALPLNKVVPSPSGFGTKVCNYLYNNNIAVSEKEQLPYFEFTVDGKNTNNKDIIYNVKLIHGEVFGNKTESNRISDKFLIFKLVEVVDGNEVELVNNKKFDTINNTILYSDKVLKNTNTEIKHTYRLYMIVDPNLVVGNTDRSDYSFNDYANLFASIKVNVDGEYE